MGSRACAHSFFAVASAVALGVLVAPACASLCDDEAAQAPGSGVDATVLCDQGGACAPSCWTLDVTGFTSDESAMIDAAFADWQAATANAVVRGAGCTTLVVRKTNDQDPWLAAHGQTWARGFEDGNSVAVDGDHVCGSRPTSAFAPPADAPSSGPLPHAKSGAAAESRSRVKT